MAYDIESLLTDIETILKASLSAKLTAITTEKGDSITLTAVNNSAYVYDLDDKEMNYDPFILMFPMGPESEGIGPATIETITININLFLNDNANDQNIYKKMFRYQRAIKEVIQTNFQRGYGKLSIQALPVLSWQSSPTSQKYKIASVNIICTMA